MLGHNLLLLWIFALTGAWTSSAVLVNRTIDDSAGDSASGLLVQYAPKIAPSNLGGGALWKSESNCDGCNIKPVNSDASSGTWTAVGYFPGVKNATATLQFQGSAIYIYFILSNYPTTPDIVSSVHCNFRLDGQIVGKYSHPTDNSSRFQYNALAYSNTSLSNANHTILLEITGPDPSYLIFDYADYTTDVQDDISPSTSTSIAGPTNTTVSTTPKKSIPTSAIVGGAVAGIVVLGMIIFALFYLRHRNRRRAAFSGPGVRLLIDPTPHSSMSLTPQLDTERAEFDEQLAEKRRTVAHLQIIQALSPILPSPPDAAALDDSDLRTQVQALKEQIRRVESLQWGNISQTSLGAPRSASYGRGVGSNAEGGPLIHPQRSMSMMKQDQTLAVANSARQGELLVHTDSGIRLMAEAPTIELPPTYAAM